MVGGGKAAEWINGKVSNYMSTAHFVVKTKVSLCKLGQNIASVQDDLIVLLITI